jgi:uncharacterized protein YceK
MKLLFSMTVIALSACATVASPTQPKPAAVSQPPKTLGTVTISGDELKQTGRTELSDALRASSPIFH